MSEKIKVFKIMRVYNKHNVKTPVKKNLTLEDAQAIVQEDQRNNKTPEKSMLCYYVQNT